MIYLFIYLFIQGNFFKSNGLISKEAQYDLL